MASSVPKELKKEIVDGWLLESTWKLALFTNASNCMTQSLYTTCTSEVSAVGTGYTTGGATVSRAAWGAGSGYVDTNNAMIDATDVTWTSATFTVRYAILYETTGKKIRSRYDLGSDYSVTDGTLTLTVNSGGLLQVK